MTRRLRLAIPNKGRMVEPTLRLLHDAGLVFLPGRPPYVVAILCESDTDAAQRTAGLAAVSGAVYEAVAATGETTWR